MAVHEQELSIHHRTPLFSSQYIPACFHGSQQLTRLRLDCEYPRQDPDLWSFHIYILHRTTIYIVTHACFRKACNLIVREDTLSANILRTQALCWMPVRHTMPRHHLLSSYARIHEFPSLRKHEPVCKDEEGNRSSLAASVFAAATRIFDPCSRLLLLDVNACFLDDKAIINRKC